MEVNSRKREWQIKMKFIVFEKKEKWCTSTHNTHFSRKLLRISAEKFFGRNIVRFTANNLTEVISAVDRSSD